MITSAANALLHTCNTPAWQEQLQQLKCSLMQPPSNNRTASRKKRCQVDDLGDKENVDAATTSAHKSDLHATVPNSVPELKPSRAGRSRIPNRRYA